MLIGSNEKCSHPTPSTYHTKNNHHKHKNSPISKMTGNSFTLKSCFTADGAV